MLTTTTIFHRGFISDESHVNLLVMSTLEENVGDNVTYVVHGN